MTKKILITPKSYYRIKDKMLPLLKDYELKFNDTGKTFTEDQMKDLVQDVDGIIIGVDPITDDVIDNANNLKAISKYGVGMDNIDVDKAKNEGIKIRKTPGTNNISVAELAIGLMFNVARNISINVNKVKNNKWERVKGVELTDKTLGVIGCGNIGQEVVKRARGLQMSVLIHDPYFDDEKLIEDEKINQVNKHELLANADFISLHLPLNNETANIISKKEIKIMKDTVFLINTARGELIDDDALLWGLKNKELAGVACDVFSQEPPNDHPLLEFDNFLLTPHIGANTEESVYRMAEQATKNIIEMLNG